MVVRFTVGAYRMRSGAYGTLWARTTLSAGAYGKSNIKMFTVGSYYVNCVDSTVLCGHVRFRIENKLQ